MPENICLTAKPRGGMFLSNQLLKEMQSKSSWPLLLSSHVPSLLPYLIPRHRAELLLELGSAGFIPAQSRAGCVTDLHVSDPLSLSHPSHTVSLQFASELLDTSTFTSGFPSNCLRALHGWTDEGNVLNSPFAGDEFPGDCSY